MSEVLDSRRMRHLISWKASHVVDVDLRHTEAWAYDIYFRSVALKNQLGEVRLRQLNNSLLTNLAGGHSQQIIEEMCRVLVAYLREYHDPGYGPRDIVVDGCFSLGYFPGTTHQELPPHAHRTLHFTTIYYVNVVPHEGDLRIWNPWTVDDSDHLVYEPARLHVLILPGNVPHDMLPHTNTEPRICVVTHFKVPRMPLFQGPSDRFLPELMIDG